MRFEIVVSGDFENIGVYPIYPINAAAKRAEPTGNDLHLSVVAKGPQEQAARIKPFQRCCLGEGKGV